MYLIKNRILRSHIVQLKEIMDSGIILSFG